MRCKFVTNGLAIDYFGTVKPCCAFKYDKEYQNNNNIKKIDLISWQDSKDIIAVKSALDQDQWPKECYQCRDIEQQGRGDSIRLNGQNAYDDYSDRDITLELRGGSTCNFACQTCWPQASSRVSQFYRQADIEFKSTQDMDWEFDLLNSIKHRLKDVVLLGGEPFYDKRCLKFLDWLVSQQIQPTLTIFTNGSVLQRDFVEKYPGRLIIVFSIDAIGKQSEYIRFGSSWNDVVSNYEYCRQSPNLETRINITTSPYNYYYLPELMEWIVQDWPSVVSFGQAHTSANVSFMDESVFQIQDRQSIINRVEVAIDKVKSRNIESMQQINAINTFKTIINNLKDLSFDASKHEKIQQFVQKMDRVKNIDIWDYCPEVAGYLDINPTKLNKFSPVFFTSDK